MFAERFIQLVIALLMFSQTSVAENACYRTLNPHKWIVVTQFVQPISEQFKWIKTTISGTQLPVTLEHSAGVYPVEGVHSDERLWLRDLEYYAESLEQSDIGSARADAIRTRAYAPLVTPEYRFQVRDYFSPDSYSEYILRAQVSHGPDEPLDLEIDLREAKIDTRNFIFRGPNEVAYETGRFSTYAGYVQDPDLRDRKRRRLFAAFAQVLQRNHSLKGDDDPRVYVHSEGRARLRYYTRDGMKIIGTYIGADNKEHFVMQVRASRFVNLNYTYLLKPLEPNEPLTP